MNGSPAAHRFSQSAAHYDSVRYDSDQKDLLVSQLKAEIYELRTGSKDYDALHRELLNLEHRY